MMRSFFCYWLLVTGYWFRADWLLTIHDSRLTNGNDDNIFSTYALYRIVLIIVDKDAQVTLKQLSFL